MIDREEGGDGCPALFFMLSPRRQIAARYEIVNHCLAAALWLPASRTPLSYSQNLDDLHAEVVAHHHQSASGDYLAVHTHVYWIVCPSIQTEE